jgi:poly-gamma-glutamate capsule biosynthesis protein CapA/YwtB (metallophosphatase superfamily)
MKPAHFLRGPLAMFMVLAASIASVRPGFAQVKKDDGKIHIALTGDSIINRRLSVFDDPDSIGLFQIIQKSDVAFTNFETLIRNDAFPGAAQSGGAYQSSPAWVTSELKWAGFNLYSTANNHAFDYGLEGMRYTNAVLDDAGLVHAGTGANLALARSPQYLDTKKGRVALIAVASTLTDGSVAGEQRPDLPGRPGVAPLRFTTAYTVDHDLFDSLKKLSALASGGGGNGEGESSRGEGHAGRTRIRIGGVQIQQGAANEVHTQPNKNDLDGLVASVSNAHRQAEWVIVSSHTHESGPGGQQTPPEFLVTAAHAAIDAGADVFVAHGPHILRGIEIYKGKPIFYSLGNFIFENETMQFQPAESFDSLGLPSTATVADYFDARSSNDTRGFPANKPIWESAVVQLAFNKDHTLSNLTLIPISLGFKEPRSERGRPRLASAEQSRETIEVLRKLSEPYGTKVSFKDGHGEVQANTNPK